MKIFLNNRLIKSLDTLDHPLLADPENQILFRWPSLLTFLGQEPLFSALTPAQEQPIFNACLAALSTPQEKEVLFYIFDRVFTEQINLIRSLPQIDAHFLLKSIKENPHSLLASFDKLAIHDLTLYLAWDRMCVFMGRLFDAPSQEPSFIAGLEVLKDCLIESYQHISQKGETAPGFYRLAEAFLFYYMREENLQSHRDAEWATLSQSFPLIIGSDELSDFYYIDDLDSQEFYLTSEPREKVKLRTEFAECILQKLKWNYCPARNIVTI